MTAPPPFKASRTITVWAQQRHRRPCAGRSGIVRPVCAPLAGGNRMSAPKSLPTPCNPDDYEEEPF